MKKNLIKLFISLIFCFFSQAGQAQNILFEEEELLNNTQENEVLLFDEEAEAVTEEVTKKSKFFELFDNDDDTTDQLNESMMDNIERHFEIFSWLDKDNDNRVDENTIVGKILHSKIIRTDVPSYLFKDDLTFKYEQGPISKIQLYAGYRGSIGALFDKGSYDTKYNNLTTQIGMYGSFRNPDYKFKLAINPIQINRNYWDKFMADAYIVNTSIPHHQIEAGYSRVQVGVEGGAGGYILPFVARSQIARTFGNTRSLALKVIGNYQYVDYTVSAGSSGRYLPSGFPGAEFNGWVNLKPFGNKSEKYGKLTLGGGLNSGHNKINYNIGSVYLGYNYKKLWTNIEAAIADGYNGSLGISSNKACGIAATVGWKINPHLQIIGRFDQFDPNRKTSHDLRREYTAGINWFIKGQALKVILNYVFCQNQNTKDSHRIILATQILI